MTPDLSRRLGRALGGPRPPGMRERLAVNTAAARVDTWEQLPADIKALVARIERRHRR